MHVVGIFRFNPGLQQKTFPDYNPYTIKRCRDCDIANGKINLVFVPENELCEGCKLIHQCYKDKTQDSERKRIEGNRKLYDRLSKDSRYIDVEFNPENGAMKATHRGHNKEQDEGTRLERKLADSLYSCGHSVVLCDESKKGRDGNKYAALDMILDGVRMDIKSITKSKDFYGSAIKEKIVNLLGTIRVQMCMRQQILFVCILLTRLCLLQRKSVRVMNI